MARPEIILIPRERPDVCEHCSLCGRIPISEIPFGGRYTRRCMMPGMERMLSGRGCKTPTARNRCKPHEYFSKFVEYSGRIPVAATAVVKYSIQQRELIFSPTDPQYESAKEIRR